VPKIQCIRAAALLGFAENFEFQPFWYALVSHLYPNHPQLYLGYHNGVSRSSHTY
jgi:hypothetical protein